MSISNSKQARKDAEKRKQNNCDYYLNYFCNFYNNSIVIENAPQIPIDNDSSKTMELPKRYLLSVLRDFGAIAYDKLTGLYLRFTEREFDVYGLPKRYTLYGYNGFITERNPSDVVILRANDLKYPIKDYLIIQSNKLSEIDNAILQNLDAVKTMTLVQTPNEKSLLSLVNLNESRRIGASVVFANKQNGNPLQNISVVTTGATYLCDKFQTLRTQIIRETLSNLGFSVSNEDKRERVQSIELDTLNMHGNDAINVLIDTFNYDAEFGGLDIRLKANTELSKITLLSEGDKNGDII